MYLGSNATANEILKYCGDCNDQIIAQVMQDYSNQISLLEHDNKILARSEEILEEQLSFGKELLESIEHGLEHARSAKQAREIFKLKCDESFFER